MNGVSFHQRFQRGAAGGDAKRGTAAQPGGGTQANGAGIGESERIEPSAAMTDFSFKEFDGLGHPTSLFSKYESKPSSSAEAYNMPDAAPSSLVAQAPTANSARSRAESNKSSNHHYDHDGSRTALVAALEAAAERQGSRRDSGEDRRSARSGADASSAHASRSPGKASNPLPKLPSMTAATSQKQHDAAEPPDGALDFAIRQMDLNGRGGRTPEPGMYGTIHHVSHDETQTRSRPSSFFGMERADTPSKDAGAIEGASNSVPYPAMDSDDAAALAREGADAPKERVRPSSFFGMEQPLGHVPTPDRLNDGPSQAARIAASHRIHHDGIEGIDAARSSPASIAPSQSASNADGQGSGGGATRPASIAPTTTTGALLDHSHLRPGEQAELLSHNKTLELYRQNAKKTNDPELIYEFAVFMIDAAKSMGADDASGGTGPTGSGSSSGHQNKDENAKEELVREAITLLRKIAERGHANAQYFLADCYACGIGTPKGKSDYDRAYPLFVLAAKHGHPDAAYRAGMSYEKGWGCRRDPSKSVQFYRKAASQSHPGALYRLGTAELNGELGLKKSAREGVKWLKRSSEAATPEFPHALHELALLHERGVDNVIYADPDYACELLAQAGEMGYAPSAYKLGVNYEYGRMGCPQDAGLSIHMYNIAAQQNHREACFALTAWYLVGAPGILPQSDTEAYLWAKKAAEQGLAKAEYSVGYFTENGIGTVRDMTEAKAWYKRAAEHGDKRASQRLVSLGVPGVVANEKNITSDMPASATSRPGLDSNVSDVNSPPPRPQNAHEQGQRIAALQRGQPSNAPFPSAIDRGFASPASGGPSSYPSPFVMREVQTREREQAHQAAVLYHQQQQQQPPMRNGFGPGQQNHHAQGGQGRGGLGPHGHHPPPSDRDLPRPPFAGGSPYGSSSSPRGSPHMLPDGRPLPPHQRRQPSGSEASYIQGAGSSSGGSHHSHGNGPPHGNFTGLPPPTRQMSGPVPSGHSGGPLAPGWNGPYPSYTRTAHPMDANHSIPVIRQPLPPQGRENGHKSMQLSPHQQPHNQHHFQPHGPQQHHGQQQQQQQQQLSPQQQPSSPTQSDTEQRKSLWKQLRSI